MSYNVFGAFLERVEIMTATVKCGAHFKYNPHLLFWGQHFRINCHHFEKCGAALLIRNFRKYKYRDFIIFILFFNILEIWELNFERV